MVLFRTKFNSIVKYINSRRSFENLESPKNIAFIRTVGKYLRKQLKDQRLYNYFRCNIGMRWRLTIKLT